MQVGPGGSRPGALSPPGPGVLRSSQAGQVMFDTQQGRSLVLKTTWFTRYPSGSPTVSPGELLSRVAAVHGELPLLLFLQEACEVRPLQHRQELPPLSQVGSVFRVWKLQPSLSESILKKPNCLRFHFNHDISQALESKAFLYVFMAGICILVSPPWFRVSWG